MARPVVRAARSIATMVLLSTLTVCGGGGDATGDGGDNITLTLSTSAVSIVQTLTATVTVTVARKGSTKDPVQLSVNVSPLLTATFNPSTISGSGGTSTLTLSTTDQIGAGTFSIFIQANSPGSAQSAELTITVVPRSTVLVVRNGTGAGTVTSNPAGINCGGACNSPFTGDVTLTAAPATGSAFTSWSGACVGTELTCTFTPRPAVPSTVNATFTSITPVFALAAAPSPLNVQQGTSAPFTVTITRTNGFTGPVTIGFTSVPAGLTITPTPTPVAGATATYTIAAAPTIGAGNYPIRINGTGTGVANQIFMLPIVVTPAASGGNITFNFASCDPTQIPIWFAVQNGAGAWTRVVPSGTLFNFALAAKGGVAMVTQIGTHFSTKVIYGSATEIASIAGYNPCIDAATGTRKVSGPFAASGPADATQAVVIGGASTTLRGDQGGSFTLPNVAQGARDLVAFHQHPTNVSLHRIILRRGQNYPNNAIIPVLDFGNSSAEAVSPGVAAIVTNNIGTDSTFISASLMTANGPMVEYFNDAGAISLSPPRARVFGLPDSLLRANDLHRIVLYAAPASGNVVRFVQMMRHSVSTDQTVTFGPALGATRVTSLGSAPYLRVRAEIPPGTAYTGGASADLFQDANTVSILMSTAYVGGAPTTWTLDVPDLSAAAYDPAWALKSGASVSWNLSAVGGDVLPFAGGAPADGAQIVGAFVSDSVTAFASRIRGRRVVRRYF